jgi:hypothetical protein
MSTPLRKKAAEIVQMKTALYRHYDVDGVLLYVGVSLSPMARTSSHSGGSEWFDSVARIDIEWHENRLEALRAEKKAIHFELPKMNKAHKNMPDKGCMTHFKTPADVIAYIGHERTAEVLGVPVATVMRARWRDKLPASWLDGLEDAAARPLPRELFTFKHPNQDRAAS